MAEEIGIAMFPLIILPLNIPVRVQEYRQTDGQTDQPTILGIIYYMAYSKPNSRTTFLNMNRLFFNNQQAINPSLKFKIFRNHENNVLRSTIVARNLHLKRQKFPPTWLS